MAETRYHRYVGELWDDLDLGDLVGEMSDFLLQSGFGTEEGELDEDQLEALHDAILDALMRRGMLKDEDIQRLLDDGEALEQFLSRNKIKGDMVVIAVPGQSGLARFVKLPPVEEKKITGE